jgi:zinc finger BED domain-containing protein 4
MIAVDLQPFSIVEDIGFRRVIKAFAPQYQIPSRKYFSETLTPKLYAEVTSKLKTIVEAEPSLAFTVDTWTSQHTTHSYMGWTVIGLMDNLTVRWQF